MTPPLKRGACNCRYAVGYTSPTRRYNWLHNLSHSNIARGVVVGVYRVAAQATLKLRLALAVSFLAMPALRIGAGRIASVNQTERYAVTNGAVLNKTSQLEKAPTAVLSPLRPSQPYPVTNPAQILELQFASGAFSRFNEVLCNLVVRVGSETSFFPRYFFQSALSRTRAALLQTRAVVKELLPLLFYLGSAKNFAVGSRSYLGNTKVYAKRAVRLSRCFVGKLALEMDIPTTFLPSNKLPALNRLGSFKQVSLVVTDGERHFQPPVNRSQAHRLIFKGQDALVVVNRRGLKAACTLPLSLADPSDSPHCQVSRQAELRADVVVGQLLEAELVKAVRLPCYFQNVVTRRCKSVNRAAQALGLTRGGLNFTAHAQEGYMSVYTFTGFSRNVRRTQFLPSPKGGGFLAALL